MTPQGRVKAKVKAVLKKYPLHAFWPVQSGYGAPTLDCLGCHHGLYFAIETKAPGKKPTPRQVITIKQMRDAGATVFVIDGDCAALEAWLETTNGTAHS